ncbi:MAG: hypothetical protein O3A63_05895 [Proteobacteria bacterium]|nr:hypothetical protein [Pseudomonadota bacterium]
MTNTEEATIQTGPANQPGPAIRPGQAGFVERRKNPDRRQSAARGLTEEEIVAFQRETSLIFNANPSTDGSRFDIPRIYHGKPPPSDA